VIRFLTVEQHLQVLSRLLNLARKADAVSIHVAGPEFTSLMVCFLLHDIAAADSLVRLRQSFGEKWFPTTVGYLIARSMFETDVTAHFISQQPKDRAHQYILFERVLKKREMDTCIELRDSKDSQWREAMRLLWQTRWANEEHQVNDKYEEVRSRFEARGRNGKMRRFESWSGLRIRDMAVEVDHKEAYDVFYSELSSFAHGDVRLANRFLSVRPEGVGWSNRAREFDVGNVFRHAASFLTCYLELFGHQFNLWDAESVERCWDVEKI